MAHNSNILYLDNYRKLVQGRTGPLKEKGGKTTPNIFCDSCGTNTMVVASVNKTTMIVKCTKCEVPKTYLTEDTKLL